MGTNLSLMAQLVFDWLDEVLAVRQNTGRIQPVYH